MNVANKYMPGALVGGAFGFFMEQAASSKAQRVLADNPEVASYTLAEANRSWHLVTWAFTQQPYVSAAITIGAGVITGALITGNIGE